MTIDLAQTSIELFIYGDLPESTSYYVNLISQLSNSQIGGDLTFDNIQRNTAWFSGDLNLGEQFQNINNEGYYTLRLYNADDDLLYKFLVKCTNSTSPNIVNKSFDGGQTQYKTFNG
mgnify:CR=1 FL=1